MSDEQQQEKVAITINDVATMLQVIDVVSRRGAFQGNEMEGVGSLRTKMEKFLQQNAPAGSEAAQAAAANQEVDVATQPGGELGGLVQS
jgi:hypothetical protein